MAVRKIIRMGHPTLREHARPLTDEEIKSSALRTLLQDMVDTLHDYGGIGLAAPQINEPIRLAIIELPAGATRYGQTEGVPLTVFANPEIEVVAPERAGYWEGCLSVPGLRGFVERPQHVRVRFKDLDANPHELELTGFPATVVQHEFDHLDGKLYIDHIEDTALIAFDEEYARYLAPTE